MNDRKRRKRIGGKTQNRFYFLIINSYILVKNIIKRTPVKLPSFINSSPIYLPVFAVFGEAVIFVHVFFYLLQRGFLNNY